MADGTKAPGALTVRNVLEALRPRIEAVLVADRGETVAAFVERYLEEELGKREAAKEMRRRLGMGVGGHEPLAVRAQGAVPCSLIRPEAASEPVFEGTLEVGRCS